MVETTLDLHEIDHYSGAPKPVRYTPSVTVRHPAVEKATDGELLVLGAAIQDAIDHWWADNLGMSFYYLTGRKD